MIVVSDTSPLTNLAAIGQFDLLRQLYGEVQDGRDTMRRAAPGGSSSTPYTIKTSSRFCCATLIAVKQRR
jgi:hypothetical protein